MSEPRYRLWPSVSSKAFCIGGVAFMMISGSALGIATGNFFGALIGFGFASMIMAKLSDHR